MAMIMKGGKVTVVVVENGAVGQRQLAEEMRREASRKIRKEYDKADQSGVAVEQRQKPVCTQCKAFDGESEVQR